MCEAKLPLSNTVTPPRAAAADVVLSICSLLILLEARKGAWRLGLLPTADGGLMGLGLLPAARPAADRICSAY